jgi:hypothetical protein
MKVPNNFFENDLKQVFTKMSKNDMISNYQKYKKTVRYGFNPLAEEYEGKEARDNDML